MQNVKCKKVRQPQHSIPTKKVEIRIQREMASTQKASEILLNVREHELKNPDLLEWDHTEGEKLHLGSRCQILLRNNTNFLPQFPSCRCRDEVLGRRHRGRSEARVLTWTQLLWLSAGCVYGLTTPRRHQPVENSLCVHLCVCVCVCVYQHIYGLE